MPTLLTDPRSGGVKKSSGVNVLPIVAETWAQVRRNAPSNDKDTDTAITYLLASYVPNSKTDIHVIRKGSGGIEGCCETLPSDQPLFGGVRLSNGRFVSFAYCGDDVRTMVKGRASMHKNGVLNVLEGCDKDIEVWEGMTEADIGKSREEATRIMADTKPKPSTNGDCESIQMIHHSMDAMSITKEESDQIISPANTPSTEEDKDVIEGLVHVNDNGSSDTESKTIPYSKLKDMTNPERYGIDPTQKELALSNSEFEEVFKMDKESFSKLAGWKRTKLKKSVLLF